MSELEQTYWKKCSTCKKEISFSSRYYLCSVSTCRHSRTGYRFCSVPCWDAHLGFANHRESWAEEKLSPSKIEFSYESSTEQSPKVKSPESLALQLRTAVSPTLPTQPENETLVVVSKVKKLISDNSSMNTSQCCIDALTNKVLVECQKAIELAKLSGRKTVMGRDIK